MILYKYRSFDNIEYILDILLNERLYCPEYKNLNDPFEGQFYSIIHTKPGFLGLKFIKFQSVGDLYASIQHSRVCSLSSSLSDVRLWSYYAGGHTGIAIAIDFTGYENEIIEVKYDDKLPEYGMGFLTSPLPKQVLTCKTSHWKYESEYRIITNSEYISIKNRIRAINLGHRISDSRRELIKKIVGSKYTITQTKINKQDISVET